jgi:hypothetical protein
LTAVGSFPGKSTVGTQKLCACDQTGQSLICAEIELVDTVKQPLAAILKSLSNVDENGLWLNPFRGIPRGARLSRFDVIYLDEDCNVLEFAESFTEAEFKPFNGQAASALILPPHTLSHLLIQKADQFRICRAKKVIAPSIDLTFSTGYDGLHCVQDLGLRGAKPETNHPKLSTVERSLEAEGVEESSFKVRLLRWLFGIPRSTDRRRGERLPSPGLVAYYWTGGAPMAYQLGNVSHSGLYLLTEERWLPGTRIVMTLQKSSGDEVGTQEIIRVESKVVRWGEDGIGCEFVQSGFVDLNTGEAVDRKFDREAFAQFLQTVQRSDSSANDSAIN